MSKQPELYLLHMRDAVKTILGYVQGLSQSDFFERDLERDAVVRQLTVLGEAAKRVNQETRELLPKIAWRSVAGTRDKIVHDYLEIDYSIVWNIVSRELPALLEQLETFITHSKEAQSMIAASQENVC